MTRTRSLSYSEIQTALTCEALAQHAFSYTGHLTGGQALKRRQIAPILSDGRAWGAAVAAWHAYPRVGDLFAPYGEGLACLAAHHALRESYAADVQEQRERGIYVDPRTESEALEYLAGVLDHYMATAERLSNLTRLEGETELPIPSRGGRRGSSRYCFKARIDGYTVDERGHQWIVEFKLRTRLHDVAQIERSRQVRWYAWALTRAQGGHAPLGVIVDERLKDLPSPARVVQGKKKGTLTPSHAKNQTTTADQYMALCEEFGEKPHPDVIEALGWRQWQKRTLLSFRSSELEEAGKELISAAMLIRDLDSGQRYPIRNGQAHICNRCDYKQICVTPDDHLLVDVHFERCPPKRNRDKEQACEVS